MEEKDDILEFYNIWTGLVRVFNIDWTKINEEQDLSFEEKLALAPQLLSFVTVSIPIKSIELTAAGQELVKTKFNFRKFRLDNNFDSFEI